MANLLQEVRKLLLGRVATFVMNGRTDVTDFRGHVSVQNTSLREPERQAKVQEYREILIRFPCHNKY